MSAGYGRGHYGAEQLDRERRRSGGGWFKIVAVVGLGAVVWLMWPRERPEYAFAQEPSPPPAPPSPDGDLDQVARSRGFPSTKAYEDSMIASARELRAAGAKVELAPHLQHLAARLESS